jgi:hypothetical protein
MQDRIRRIDENLLQRTAGPYIRVNRVVSTISAMSLVCLQFRTYCVIATAGTI